jgi:genome maintenance exonuclease 1
VEFIHETIDIGYDDLVADTQPSGRTYVDPDGNRYPSITTVLSILSEEAIAAWRKRVGDEEANRIGHRASSRGTSVHAIIEKYLLNEDTTDYLPHIRQSLENVRPILDKNITKIYGLETALYSRHLGVAGRCDCVGVFDGVPSIIDFKTSRRVKTHDKISNYFAQMAGYAVMWEERTGMPITNTVIIMDVDDNEPIVFREHRDNHIGLLIDTIKEYKRRQLFFK